MDVARDASSCALQALVPVVTALCAAVLIGCLFHKAVLVVGGAAFVAVAVVVYNGADLDAHLSKIIPGAPKVLGVSALQWGTLAASFLIGCVCVHVKDEDTRLALSSALAGTLAISALHVQGVPVPFWAWMVGCVGGVAAGLVAHLYCPRGRRVSVERRTESSASTWA